MQAFAAIVGADHVLPPARPKLADAAIEAVVEPGTADEVAACLAAARSAGVPVIARGGGSKLHWGNPPDKSPIVLLDLSRLSAVSVLDPEEGNRQRWWRGQGRRAGSGGCGSRGADVSSGHLPGSQRGRNHRC